MTLLTSFDHTSSTRRRLPGSPHWGGDWRLAVRNLRAAVENAIHHARWQSRFTTDQVGTEVIDLVEQLDGQALAVLHVLIGELAKQSKKRAHQW
jgi:hypothetical protein